MTEHLRKFIRGLLGPIEDNLARSMKTLGLSPNLVTILGFIFVVTASVFIAMGHLTTGGLLFFLGCLFDMIDGSLARLSNNITPAGSLLDSVFDRLGEAALFIGLSIYGSSINADSRNITVYFVLLLIALVSSQGVSYIRAKAKALNVNVTSGFMTRPERVVTLALGLIFGEATLLLALGFVAFFSTWTMFTRFLHVYNELKSD